MDVPGTGTVVPRRAQGLGRWAGAGVVILIVGAALFFTSRHQDRWVRTESPSAGGGTPGVVFSLDADAPVNGWLDSTIPTLRVSCADGVVGLYIQTRLSAAVEPGTSRTVRLQFDDEAPEVTKWEQAANHQSLYPAADGAAPIARRLARATRFRFAFVPFRADAVVASFSLYGFAEHWRVLETHCGGLMMMPKDTVDPHPPPP